MNLRLSDFPYTDVAKQAMARFLPLWDWRWCPAQLWQESRWNPNAVNARSGATGIAQFMPATWRECSDNLRFYTYTPRDTEQAIQAYAYYMTDMRRIWSHIERTEDERRKLAMACYNCGAGHMLSAQKLAGGSPHYDDIIAKLPDVTGAANAKETTDYVRLIEQHYATLTAGESP